MASDQSRPSSPVQRHPAHQYLDALSKSTDQIILTQTTEELKEDSEAKDDNEPEASRHS